MNAKRNLAHYAALFPWVAAGILLTGRVLFTDGSATLGMAVGFWCWWAAFAGVTTLMVRGTQRISTTLGIHGATFIVLSALPHTGLFKALRYGLDLIQSA